jgi:hypothetical protein
MVGVDQHFVAFWLAAPRPVKYNSFYTIPGFIFNFGIP